MVPRFGLLANITLNTLGEVPGDQSRDEVVFGEAKADTVIVSSTEAGAYIGRVILVQGLEAAEVGNPPWSQLWLPGRRARPPSVQRLNFSVPDFRRFQALAKGISPCEPAWTVA
eukprot:12461798-Alexandrium_andersonii.AAC.1